MSADTEEPRAPASSIFGDFSATVEEQVSKATKILPVGSVAGFYCEYRALTDEESDSITTKFQARAKLRSRTGQAGDDHDGERQAAALVLATACVQLMVPSGDDPSGYEPMHEVAKRQGIDCPPLRYNRDLMSCLADAGTLPAGLTVESGMTDIVRVLHRKGESTAPLTSMYSLYEAWRAGVTSAIVNEALA